MLENIRIQNFKGWKDTGALKLAPISLFFGVNSSGKSSVGQFLMMLKQTITSQDRRVVLNPGDRNSIVSLGSFTDMVHGHNPDSAITFEHTWLLPQPKTLEDKYLSTTFSYDRVTFGAEVALDDVTLQNIVLKQFAYQLLEGKEKQLEIGIGSSTGTYKVETDRIDLRFIQGRPKRIEAPIRFYGFPDEVVAYHQNADFVKDLNLAQENLFNTISYLGPLRSRADRIYSWNGIKPDSVGTAGEYSIAALLAAKNRKLSFAGISQPIGFEEVIARQLKRMNLVEDFEVKPVAKEHELYEVSIKTPASQDYVHLPDVGFGISQVLPVLVQCFYAPKNSIIIMEQPEIHLHPSAQSALADVLIDVITSKENGEDRNIQLIIETHSEHFLRRLQRRIAEQQIQPDHVAAYFANISNYPAQFEPLQIDIFGRIANWPEHFFGDDFGDVAMQTKASIERRRLQSAVPTA